MLRKSNGLFDTLFFIRGITGAAYFFGKDNSRVYKSGRKTNGSINARKALEKSSNAFMVDWVGEKLFNKYGSKAVDVWDRYMKKFGLRVSTESGLPNDIEYTNIEQAGSYLAAIAYVSFCQSGKYTTLQLAQYATMLANQGARIKPQLASKIVDQNCKVVKKSGTNNDL